MDWKKNWKCLSVIAFTGIAIGATTTSVVLTSEHKAALATCKANVATYKKAADAYCEGYELGDLEIRLTEVICNNKVELCFCGDPSVLKSGGI